MIEEVIEIRNARITSVELGYAGFNVPSAWLHLDYGGAGQGFGGWCLSGPAMSIFVMGVLDTLKLDEWNKLPGQIIRVKQSHSKVHAIGHPIEDKWFDPVETFKKAEVDWVYKGKGE
jgi:hypothetical protein